MTSTAAIHPIVGTRAGETIQGTRMSDVISGRGGNDVIAASVGNDQLWGGSGDDRISGGSGHNVIHGSGGPSLVQPTLMTITEDYDGKVIFQGETAGYRNTFGWYKIDGETGQIVDADIIWANASRQGSGGDLVVGQSEVPLALAAGDQIGFFIVANGFSQNNFGALEGGSYQFRNADGSPATLDSVNPGLWHVGDDGQETQINGHKYHTAGYGDHVRLNADGEASLARGDGFLHTTGVMQIDEGTVTLGFEDLYLGGDQDFDDTVFTVDIGQANAQLLNAHYAVDGGKHVIEEGVLLRADDAQADLAGADLAGADLELSLIHI